MIVTRQNCNRYDQHISANLKKSCAKNYICSIVYSQRDGCHHRVASEFDRRVHHVHWTPFTPSHCPSRSVSRRPRLTLVGSTFNLDSHIRVCRCRPLSAQETRERLAGRCRKRKYRCKAPKAERINREARRGRQSRGYAS